MKSKDIKQSFLEFFKNNDHTVIQGSSLLPKNDPSLLFINSGMAPMKPYFTGERIPPSPRLTNVQPCIRTNDIDDVGDKHHLTFFEMLGSWSINDYYKVRAIELALGLLTQGLGLDIKRLYVSVYSGNDQIGIPYDDASHRAWLSLGIPESRITALGDDDNFWGPAGDEGPCGPCTEIFIDTGVPKDETSYEATGIFDTKSRYIEIWNAGVFMELYKDKTGNYSRLKQHNVDTGAGLERLSMAINGLSSVYETDIYSGINEVISSAISKELRELADLKAMRTIADHIRAATFILGEGVTPDKNREGYIPRRLIRRSVAAISRLQIEKFPYGDAVDAIIDYSREDYPHLAENAHFIKTAISNEQTSFARVLRQGEKSLKRLMSENGENISGQAAFNLTASHGIPLDILLSMVDSAGGNIDIEGYNKSMAQHRDISRSPR